MRPKSEHQSKPEAFPFGLLVASTCGAICTLSLIALYQVGVLNHLPDPPSDYFDSDGIADSKAAHPLGIPDGLLGLGSYGITLSLVLLSRGRPKARKLLATKLLADGTIAGVNTVRQIVSFRKLCSWCTATALCTGVMVLAGNKLLISKMDR